jgi:IclR family pca regulon transcriptional regulator
MILSIDSLRQRGRAGGTQIDLEEGMGGLAKGLAIAECFDREHHRLTVTEAATMTGQTPAAARRCMRTLEALGYLSHDGKFFRPTPRFVRLAVAYTDADPLPRLAMPLLDGLRDELGESASIAVLDGSEVLFVARAEAPHIVVTGQRVGGRMTASLSAAGRILMGALDDDEVRRLVESAGHGPSTGKALRGREAITAEVRAAAARGYSITDEEVEIGLRAIAVPVVDSTGALVAAMTMSAPSARAGVDRMTDAFLPGLRRAAAALGRML